MPWIEVNAMQQREEFVALAGAEGVHLSRLCERFKISRKTGYKWLARAGQRMAGWSHERSRRPHKSPLRVDWTIEQAVLDVRGAHTAWGGRKIRRWLINHGMAQAPSPSTITAILHRHGCIDPEQSLQRGPMQRFERETPNELWQMDFKGKLATAAGPCHPLSVVDDHSRYALLVKACADQRTPTVRAALEATMRVYGLPQRMLMDNGACWGKAQGLWTVLGAWLIRLGIMVSHGRFYHPQTQGKCERFNRTLQAEALRGRNFRDLAACQPVFDRFRHDYNHERPHEALAMELPASRYRVSVFAWPQTLPAIEYLHGDQVRQVGPAGYISFHKERYHVGRAFTGQPVALRATSRDGEWAIYFCHQRIATIDARTQTCKQQR